MTIPRTVWLMPVLASLTLMLASAPRAWAQPRFDFDRTPGHLSKQVLPSHVALSLDLDPARADFSGEVRITLRLRRPERAIELHAHELTATGAQLVSAQGARELRIEPQAATQSWRLTPTDGAPIAAGEHRLVIRYGGRVHVYGDGLFVAPYQVAGQPRRMLATQLEAIFARTLFPAFDEPAFRAVYEISVRAPREFEVMSNMPRRSRVLDGAKATHRFAPTPPMPSYLVSVTVGRFDVLAGRAAGVPLRVLTAEGKREHGRYALNATRELLPYFTGYFGVPYALPKLDQLAVPSTRWGAMEDWGLISYSEDALLVDRQRSSGDTMREVYETVAHEIAHQWFGNLVTAASWEEIWLNEAFATWMQTKATDRFNPGWQILLQNRLPVDRAMALDAGAATRAIRSGPVRETAVSDVFDSITYAKGGAVLSMLEQWMGPRVFRDGLVAYMKDRRLSNATAGDLWHHVGRSSGLDVAAVAASWTDQPGFPLVQVASGCDGDRLRVTLSQRRFTMPGAFGGVEPAAPALWKIPLRLAQGRSHINVLLDRAEQSFTLGACSDEPLIVNAGGAGFYRVAYSDEALRALTRRFASLAPPDRVTLLSDSFARMQAGQLGMPAYTALLEALPRVADSSRGVLWSLASAQLDFLDIAMMGTPAQQQLHALARSLLAPQLASLGWAPRPNEDTLTSKLRATLIVQLAKFDHSQTAQQALRLFDDDDGRSRLPASIRSAVVRAAGMHADRARFERLLARLKSAASEEDRWTFAVALASGRDAARAEQLLTAALTGVAPANIASALPGMVARHSPFGELAYRVTASNWQRFAELAGNWGKGQLLPQAAQGFSDAERAARLIEDQREKAGPDGAVPAAREAEQIRLRAAVKARDAAGLEKMLPS
ncbi:aminopeptidase N [Burkholderiaceae bacterium]|nr:aminopeptidase N [Burkholderiaceae bacterium]